MGHLCRWRCLPSFPTEWSVRRRRTWSVERRTSRWTHCSVGASPSLDMRPSRRWGNYLSLETFVWCSQWFHNDISLFKITWTFHSCTCISVFLVLMFIINNNSSSKFSNYHSSNNLLQPPGSRKPLTMPLQGKIYCHFTYFSCSGSLLKLSQEYKDDLKTLIIQVRFQILVFCFEFSVCIGVNIL